MPSYTTCRCINRFIIFLNVALDFTCFNIKLLKELYVSHCGIFFRFDMFFLKELESNDLITFYIK